MQGYWPFVHFCFLKLAILNEERQYYSEIKPKGKFGLNLRELAEYKELFYFFTWRDIKVKYRQTLLGFLWAVLQPLIMMVIFTFFMAKTMRVASDGMEYPVFAFSGLILWLLFSSGLTNAGNSMISNSQIIKKIYFPRLVIPIASVLVSLFDFLVTIPVFVILLIVLRQPVDVWSGLVFWPVGLLLTIIATLGPGSLLAALNVKYRDFRYVIPFLVQALLFLTPAIYPITILKNHWLQYLLAVNPMYAAITVFRLPMTQAAPDVGLILVSVASGIFFLFAGLFYFTRTESYFADLT